MFVSILYRKLAQTVFVSLFMISEGDCIFLPRRSNALHTVDSFFYKVFSVIILTICSSDLT